MRTRVLATLFDSFATVLVSDYSMSIATVTGLGEAALMVWLLVKASSIGRLTIDVEER
jgi:hypothetical protein